MMSAGKCALRYMLGILLLGSAANAGADLAFDSDFTGVPNWNWDSATGSVGGTDAMTASFGDPVARAYVNKAVASPGEDSADGTGHMRVSFDVDVSDLAFNEWYNGTTVFEIDTLGNKGAFANGYLAGIAIGNWKASAGVKGQYRFSVSTSQIYQNGGSAVMSVLTPTGEAPWIYHVVMDLFITKTDSGWPVTADLTVTGPHSGNTVTWTVSTTFTMTYGSYAGFRSIESGYFFGGLSTGNVYPGSSLAFDNLLIEWIVPPPVVTVLTIQ